MSTSVYTMARNAEPALAKRLELLTGEDAACCIDDLRAEAKQVRLAPGFARALAAAKAMSDEGRLTAMALLKRRGEMCACEIQAALGVTHATVSHHMGQLVEAGLIEVERRGKWAYYRLTDSGAVLAPRSPA